MGLVLLKEVAPESLLCVSFSAIVRTQGEGGHLQARKRDLAPAMLVHEDFWPP